MANKTSAFRESAKKIGIYQPRSVDEANEMLNELNTRSEGITNYLNSDKESSVQDRIRYQDQITGARRQLDTISKQYGTDLSENKAWYDEANSVMQDRKNAYVQRVMQTEAENNWGKPDTRTTLQKATDKLLGVDRTKVTGGKTDWGKLAEGAAVKGANQANAGFWSGVGIFNDIGKKITNSKVGNWLFGDLADGANAIATTTINGAIDTINSIFGTNYAGIKNGQSALDFLVSDAQAGKANAEAKYEKNANTSRAAQIIDQFGTSTVAAIPMAIEAAILAPSQAAQAAQVTSSGLSYFSGLQNAKGAEAIGMMGREGLNKLFRNPQFWTSYLQAAGDGYESAKEDGMNQDDAAVYALTNGFFNAMVEVGGADEALGGIQNLPMRLRQAAESGNKSAVVNWFKDSVLGEAWEEVQQGALERGIKSFFGQDVPIFSLDPTDDRAIINPYTAGQEFLGGAVVGGVLGGGQVAANSAVQSVSDSRTFKGDANALIKAAKNSTQEADQTSIAQIESAMAARKSNTITMGEARTLQEIASRTGNMHTYVQNILQAENQQRADQQREASQQSRVSRYLERVRAGEVDQTGTADTKGATIQYEGRQAKVDFVRDGDQNRVRLTFDDGTERTVSYQEAADAGLDENVRNLMVALSAIGPNAPAAYSVYESDQEVGRYAAAMDEAINLYAAQGQDVRKAAAAARESNSPAMITYLTDAQLELAQSLGSKIYEQKQTQVKEAGAKLAEIRQAAQQAMSAQDVTATEGLTAVNATLTDARQHLKNVQAAFNDTMEYLDEMAANGQEGTEAYQNALEQANALRNDLDGTQKVIEALEGERKNLQARQPIKRKQGTVSFAGGTINGEKVNGVDRSKLNRQQKNVVAMVEALADAVNVDYVFFDGDAKGNQGAYVQGGTVYININAGMAANKALAAATLSHELTHYMQEFAPEEYEQLKQFIISNVLQKGELDRLVQQQLRLEPNLSYDQALDEVVANACQTMLQDSKAIAKLARQNMTLAEKIADYIEDITARLKAAFEDVNYKDNLPLYNAVKAMEDQLDEMQRLWDAGIEAATENYNAKNTVRSAREQAENAQETQNLPENAEEMPAAAQREDTQNQQWDNENDILNAIEEYEEDGYVSFGIRADRAGIAPGEELDASHQWYQDDPADWDETNEYPYNEEYGLWDGGPLAGVSTVGIGDYPTRNDIGKAIKNAKRYLKRLSAVGDQSLYLVGSKIGSEGGNDPGEFLLYNGIVLGEISTEPEERTRAQFQMWETVEETDKLIAVHNKSVSGLRRMLQRHGVPFPSIAIKKAGTPHEGFGDVSIVFPRSTIDPEVNRQNRLYSNDAWTPTEPIEEYDVGDMYRYHKKFRKMIGEDVYSGLKGSSYLEESDVSRKLQYNRGDIFAAVKDISAVKYAYLKSIGQEPQISGKAGDLFPGGNFSNEEVLAVFDAFGTGGMEAMEENDDATRQKIRDALNEWFAEKYAGTKLEKKARESKPYENRGVWPDEFKRAWENYKQNNYSVKVVPDYDALDRSLRSNSEVLNDPGYKEWIEEQFSDLIKDKGIPNGKDYYTPSGNVRSFKARHVPATLENIVAQMQKEQERGVGVMGVNLRGAATKAYRNVEEMRADSGRLLGTHVSDDVYDSYMKGFQDRLYELTQRAANGSERWEVLDSAQEILLETLRDSTSKQNMDTRLRREAQWINYSKELANDLWALRNDVQNMPAPYFEAKPRRVVYPEEALAYILPDNADQDVVDQLNQRGYNVLTYKAGDEADRLEKLNSVEGSQFQIWDNTGDDTASEDAGRRMAYAMIQAENSALKDAIAGLNKLTNKQNTTIAKLEQKLRLTKTPEVRQSDANRLARQLVKDHSSTADAARVAAELKALGDYILQNKEIDADVVKQRARAIAAEIVQNAETTVDYGGELAMYRNITSDIKGKKLTIDEDFLGELDAVDGYDAFRKRNFANFTLAKRETGDSAGREGYSTVGSYYSTLQQQYGEAYFPEVANEGEQIQVIADMFQRAKGITVNPNEEYMGEATEELANRIAFDVMDGIMRPVPPTQADRQKARTDALRQQIKDLQKEGALSEKEADMLRKTIYDLTLALDNAESRYKTLQVTSDERFRQMQAEGKERAVEAKLRERARQEEKIAALKDHYQEMADRARDRRENTHTRHKIRKLVDRLNKMLKSPTEKRHIPRELVKETIAVLEMIDLDTGRSANITAQLAKIRQMYEGYKNNPTYAVGYDETVDEMLSNLQQTIGETPLHKMTAEQLEAVYSTLRALNHVISTAVQVQIGEQERNAFELAESMTAETRDIPKAQKGWLRSHYLPAHLRADVMFNRLGGHKKNSVWSQIARMLNDGQLKQTMIKMQLSTPFASLVNDERALQDFTGTDKRGRIDQKKLVDIGLKDKDGNTIKVTHGIMVGIYMDLLNEQNRRHLIRGGKTIPNLNDYYSGKGGFGTGTVRAVGIATELSDLYHQMNEAKEDGDTDLVQELEDRIEEVQLSGETYADTMQKSIESQMTAFDRKWVAAIQQLMDVDSKAFLNATTMEVYGIEKASVDNYYPITSDPSFLSTPFESITKDMNLENVGFMKERVLNASNPTLAMDVSDVVNNQINRVAQYCGLMPAIRNFNKVYNKTEGGYNDSLKNAINDVFGKEGKKYIENLMADLTGSRRSSEDSLGLSRILGGLRGNLAQTTLTLNPRVALAQAASYPTAAAELGWGPLVKAFAHGGKNGRMISRADAQLIAEYSPLLWYRMQGYSQQELADATNRNDYAGRLWKKMRWATGWIQAVDGATVGRLWYAAEYWVDANKPDLKKGTDAYYQEVAKKFNDVVEKTQPNYTTMQRADVLRSPSDLVKTLTMFMTQRLQNFNIIYDSTAGYQKARADFASGRNGVTATDVKEAKTQMVQAVTSQLAQAAVFTAFKMFADALLHNMNGYRDDETGDLTPESVIVQLLRNYIDALVGAAIFGSEIYSLIKVFTAGDSWYGLSVNGVDSVNDLVDDTVNLMKTDVDTSTEKGRAKLGNNILKAAQSWAQLLGAPLRNAIKMVSSVRYHIEDIKNGEFLSFEAGYERTKKQIAFKENIQPVGISGKQYEKILKQMNTDKSGSVTQAEAYAYLSEEYAKGKLSKEQVDGIWNAQGWSKAYDEYAETAEKAAVKEAEQNRNLEAAGVTPEQYEAMKAEMNTDGNSSVTQEEAGRYLQDQVNAGNLTEAQADALWKVVCPTWKKTYGQWQGNETEPTTTQTVRPAPTPESVKITTYDQFKSAAHIYSDKRETAYNLWESSVQPLGIDLDRYVQYINVSDVNDNGSVTQEELGATLTEAINRGELNGDQAEAIWHTLWNGGRSKTYASWAAKNATRGGMPSQEELLELNENPDRYDVGDTTVTAAEILAETLDRGQQITRVGETYQLIPGEYPSRKLYGEWLPVLNELGIDPGDVWENGQNVTLSQMSQYYTPEEYRERIEYMRQNRWWIDLGFEEEPTYAANELYLGWQEHPDYPGQSFEEYLNTPESQSWLQQLAQMQSEAAGGEWDRFTGGTARNYRGTGQKARRSGEALYVSRAMRDSKRGRR